MYLLFLFFYSSRLLLFISTAQELFFVLYCFLGGGMQGITFLTGAAGVHAVGAAVAQRTGDETQCRRHAREVADMEELGGCWATENVL